MKKQHKRKSEVASWEGFSLPSMDVSRVPHCSAAHIASPSLSGLSPSFPSIDSSLEVLGEGLCIRRRQTGFFVCGRDQ